MGPDHLKARRGDEATRLLGTDRQGDLTGTRGCAGLFRQLARGLASYDVMNATAATARDRPGWPRIGHRAN